MKHDLTAHVTASITTGLTTQKLVHDHDVPRFVAALTPIVVEHVLDWVTTRQDNAGGMVLPGGAITPEEVAAADVDTDTADPDLS